VELAVVEDAVCERSRGGDIAGVGESTTMAEVIQGGGGFQISAPLMVANALVYIVLVFSWRVRVRGGLVAGLRGVR
jgi:hypothetical protein